MKSIDGRAAGSILNVALGCALAPVGDVVADRVVEQDRVLGDDADRGAEAPLGYAGDVLAIDANAPGGRVVEAVEEPGDGRLAGAGRTDDRAARPRRDVEIETLQNLAARVVAEAQVLEADVRRG